MEKFRCPHCKKEIELGEVAEKRAQSLAAQKEKNFKDLADKRIKEADKKAQDQIIKERQKLESLKKKEIEDNKKNAVQEAKKDFLKVQKEKDLKIKQLELDKKKDIQAAIESAEAVSKAKNDEKLKQEKKQSEQEKNVLKLKIERMQKDIEKAKERGNQGLTADQGSAQEITIGKLLREVFEDKDDEITAYEKGEPGADWLQKVKNGGVEIGRILYESKKTKSFSKNWIDKLQQDMKETKADVGIIFTTAVPKEFNQKKAFLQKGNIFICNYNFEKLRMLAELQRKFLEKYDLMNKNESKDNKKSALEFFSSPDFQNLMGLIQNNMFGLEDIVGKQKKLTRDLEKQYLNFDGYLDEFFAMTAEYGLKKKDKK